jgi:hypothetical protein
VDLREEEEEDETEGGREDEIDAEETTRRAEEDERSILEGGQARAGVLRTARQTWLSPPPTSSSPPTSSLSSSSLSAQQPSLLSVEAVLDPRRRWHAPDPPGLDAERLEVRSRMRHYGSVAARPRVGELMGTTDAVRVLSTHSGLDLAAALSVW